MIQKSLYRRLLDLAVKFFVFALTGGVIWLRKINEETRWGIPNNVSDADRLTPMTLVLILLLQLRHVGRQAYAL
jgi:hypothetical protein